MPTFRYLAKRGPQEVIEGVFEADTRANVLTHLAGLGYTPVQIREARTGGESSPAARARVSDGEPRVTSRSSPSAPGCRAP